MISHSDPDPGSSAENYDLLDRLADEFVERFRRGEGPSLKEYTDRYPDLANDIQALSGTGNPQARNDHSPTIAAAAQMTVSA